MGLDMKLTYHFTPNPTRLRDWITLPKNNGYEALHLTVVGPKINGLRFRLDQREWTR